MKTNAQSTPPSASLECNQAHHIDPDGVYSSALTAEILGITPRTLANWRRQRLISYRKIGGVVIFLGSDLLEALGKHAVKRRD